MEPSPKKSLWRSFFKNPTRRWAWLFLGPVLVCFVIGFVWPFIQGIYLSFCGTRSSSGSATISRP